LRRKVLALVSKKTPTVAVKKKIISPPGGPPPPPPPRKKIWACPLCRTSCSCSANSELDASKN